MCLLFCVILQDNKNRLGGTLAAALRAVMNAVYPLNREADNMAGNIVEIQRKLTTNSRYYIGPDLDRHLDAIIQNSMAVGHVSRDQYREAIQKLCGEVQTILIYKKHHCVLYNRKGGCIKI